MYDCYYDASYYLEKKCGIAGVYMEDQHGKKIIEKQFPFEGIEASQQAEAFALEKALEMIEEYNSTSIRLLGDCKSLIEGIWEGKKSHNRLRDQMKQTRLSMNQLVWIYREYNKAHGLTQPIHMEKERPIYEVEVVYTLTENAYIQYKDTSKKRKHKPHALIEKKLNQHIEETKYFNIKVEDDVHAFFRYGFVLFTKENHIIALYKSEDNKNQYGLCKNNPEKLKRLFCEVTQPNKNQA